MSSSLTAYSPSLACDLQLFPPCCLLAEGRVLWISPVAYPWRWKRLVWLLLTSFIHSPFQLKQFTVCICKHNSNIKNVYFPSTYGCVGFVTALVVLTLFLIGLDRCLDFLCVCVGVRTPCCVDLWDDEQIPGLIGFPTRKTSTTFYHYYCYHAYISFI